MRKDIGCSNHIALSGKVMSLQEYVTWCSKNCTPKFEIVPMVEESVMAACFSFLLVVLEYNATTIIVIGMSGVKWCLFYLLQPYWLFWWTNPKSPILNGQQRRIRSYHVT